MRPLFAFVLCFFTTTNHKLFRISPQIRFLDAIFTLQFSYRCRHHSTAVATLIARWRNGKCRAVAMSKSRPAGGQSEGRCKRPSGVRGGTPEQKYVSKMTHGFFITINSMILYFKHIIHIDDFPLNGHPPSVYYN